MDSLELYLNFDAHADAEPGVVVPDEAMALQATGGLYLDEAAFQMQGFDFGDLEFPVGFSNEYPAGFEPSLPFGVEFPPIDSGVDSSDDMMRFLDYPGGDQNGSISTPSTSPPPASPEEFFSQSPASTTISLDAPLPWDYNDLQANIAYDPALQEAFHMMIDKIFNSIMPTKDDFHNFVMTRRGRYFCAVEGCPWYDRGWKREDRGVAHVKKEHFRLMNYRCEECNRDYKWSHDLTKHRKVKHPQDGEAPPPKYHCLEPGCRQTFGKSSNLTRHRKVHKKAAVRRKARL